MQEEALWEFANLSLVVLGFSGVVAVLGRRALGEWTQGDVKRLNLMGIAGLRLLIAGLFTEPSHE